MSSRGSPAVCSSVSGQSVGNNRRHQCQFITKRVGTTLNLDYGLEHGLYYELDMDSIIDSSMDLTVKDYEC